MKIELFTNCSKKFKFKFCEKLFLKLNSKIFDDFIEIINEINNKKLKIDIIK